MRAKSILTRTDLRQANGVLLILRDPPPPPPRAQPRQPRKKEVPGLMRHAE